MHGLQLAALYTLQHRLARDAEPEGRFEHREILGRRLLDEAEAGVGDVEPAELAELAPQVLDAPSLDSDIFDLSGLLTLVGHLRH